MILKKFFIGDPVCLGKKLAAMRADKGTPLNRIVRELVLRDWSKNGFPLLIHPHTLGDVSGYSVGNWSVTERALYVAIVHAFRCPVNLYPIDLDVEFVYHVSYLLTCLLYTMHRRLALVYSYFIFGRTGH